MELTPELFETTEFTERRKGYDIDEVETFLEKTGTALAQLLARTRHTEERAAHAEARLADAQARIDAAEARAESADGRIAAAEQRAAAAERAAAEASQAAATAAAGSARIDEDAEVHEAAKTLLMAKKTADATVSDARAQAQTLVEEAQHRAQRQLNEANAEAAELIRRANEQAEAEYADRRAAVLDEVRTLEARRAQLADVMTQLESRLAGYREELGRTAQELLSLAEDPLRLGARPTMTVTPDEVLSSSADDADAGDAADGDAGDGDDAEPEPSYEAPASNEPVAEQADPAVEASAGGSTAAVADVDADSSTSPASQADPAAEPAVQVVDAGADEDAAAPGTATAEPDLPADEADGHFVDLTGSTPAATGTDDRWGPGSWSQVQAELLEDEPDRAAHLDRPTEAVSATAVPKDRFMEELDSAVNDVVRLDDDDEDAAMTAFFEGGTDTRTRRFGWRR